MLWAFYSHIIKVEKLTNLIELFNLVKEMVRIFFRIKSASLLKINI